MTRLVGLIVLALALVCLSNAQDSCPSNPLVGFTALTPEQLRGEIRSNLQESMAEILDALSKEISTQSSNSLSEINSAVQTGQASVLELNKQLEQSILNNMERVVETQVKKELANFFESIINNLTAITQPTLIPTTPTTRPTEPPITPMTTTTATTNLPTTTTTQPTEPPTTATTEPTEPPTTATTQPTEPPTTATTQPTEPPTQPTQPTTTKATTAPPPTTPQIGLTPLNPAVSCQEVLETIPEALSGNYWVVSRLEGGQTIPRRVYCDMERSCGGLSGGWMRAANVNMRDLQQTCPENFQVWTDTNLQPLRLCRTVDTGAGCIGSFFPVNGISYSHVCGRIIGYQDRTPNAFFPYQSSSTRSIDDVYVDGISLTHGTERQHIWTFAAALDETLGHLSSCRCSNAGFRQAATIPDFVSNDYFCDTGSREDAGFEFYDSDPLWDGAGCGEVSSCCTFNNPPWFYKSLIATSDDIEMRVCRDSPVANEDILLEIVELYVR